VSGWRSRTALAAVDRTFIVGDARRSVVDRRPAAVQRRPTQSHIVIVVAGQKVCEQLAFTLTTRTTTQHVTRPVYNVVPAVSEGNGQNNGTFAWTICRSVCRSVRKVHCGKTAEWIQMSQLPSAPTKPCSVATLAIDWSTEYVADNFQNLIKSSTVYDPPPFSEFHESARQRMDGQR